MRISLSKMLQNFLTGWLRTSIVILMLFNVAYAQPHYVTIPAGTYTIGKKGHQLNPLRTVTLDSFRIATTETTNQQFAAFVKSHRI